MRANPDAFVRLVDIMARLRARDGCPWDRVQTPESLKTFVVEETYELLDAIDSGQPSAIQEELGDLLLQIVFQAQIADERGQFDIDAVCNGINEKLVRRHPHVFDNAVARTPGQVVERWEEIKARKEGKALLSGVPRALPALLKAQRVSEKAARVGFDWNHAQPVFDKVEEELDEIRAAVAAKDQREVVSEVGDLLFAVVNLARHLEVNAEEALSATVDRFIRRFGHIEKELSAQGRRPEQCDQEELDRLWEEAKALERS